MTLDAATDFMWANARLIDRQLFAFQHLGAPVAPVLKALAAYQNADGGFAGVLEIDQRGPDSQTVATQAALAILADVGALDHPMTTAACDWLVSVSGEDGGVPFVLPSAGPYPHAFWWDPPAVVSSSINPTAAIAGLLHAGGISHPWLDAADEFVWRVLEPGQVTEGPHAVLCAFEFLEHAPDRDRASALVDRVGKEALASDAICLDPSATDYVLGPLDFAPRPDRAAVRLFDRDVIDRHLDVVVAGQQTDGGWLASWPAPTPTAGLEARGMVTRRNVAVLAAYGRL